ncbi:MAG: pimeloyl-ACP methyl ester carboxylesterase, partial [Gammaproteobacteria bacterium]
CLAMQSDQDFYPVELGRYIAETAQQGSLHIFEGCGHSVQLQNYEVFNKVLSSFIPT